MKQTELAKFLMAELGDDDNLLLPEAKDQRAFIKYLDKACLAKLDKKFPRKESVITEVTNGGESYYWLAIAYALADKFITTEKIK